MTKCGTESATDIRRMEARNSGDVFVQKLRVRYEYAAVKAVVLRVLPMRAEMQILRSSHDYT